MAQYTYTSDEVCWIVEQMLDYLRECKENGDESIHDYFRDIVETGLFHDACGNVFEDNGDSVIVTTDY